MQPVVRYAALLVIIMVAASCSTQKNTLLTRTYNQVTAKYNAFFNGRESFRTGVRNMERNFRYDYNKVLPVFLYTDPDLARSAAPHMDRAIDKASKVITNKSITVRPEEGRGFMFGRDEDFYQLNEYNKWVRQSYLLAGKAHFHKHDFVSAAQAFMYVIREYALNEERHEARVWLMRTYIESGRFNEARLLFGQIIDDPEFPADLEGELYATVADYHLRLGQPSRAAENLERALEQTRGKDTRVRYNYILAQLYESIGDYSRASEYYARVIGMNPPYEMVFNARLGQAGVVETGSGETGRMINTLERMLRDEKNRDFEDQIYYALGNIYLRDGDEQNAIKHYELSATARGTNPSQKSLTFLALADIYFAHPDYVSAAEYYDSAIINMDRDFPDMEALQAKSAVLNALVDNILIYRLEDSLQLLASMSETERNRKIDDIIAMARQEEADARQRERLAQQTPEYRTARTAQSARYQAERTGGGSWYFYNPSAVTFGQNEFESIWGERRLEDNWRRSNRQTIAPAMMADAGSDPVTDTEEEDEDAPEAGSREFYLRDIPLTGEAMMNSHYRLEEALYNMGLIFKDDLRDFERSEEAFLELVSRYPEGYYALPALYDLYNMNMDNNNLSAAHRYEQMIVDGYPGSPYAAILTNPDYFKEYEEKLQAAERYYEETFYLFRDGYFDEVSERTLYASAMWPESDLIPRFEYLRTLSYGSRGNIPMFRDMLTEYISSYPGTEMADNAMQFIAYLDDDYAEAVQFAEVVPETDIYMDDQEGEHYFVVIVDNNQDIINRMVFNIVNFNVDNFARFDLNVSSESFTRNYHILRVEGLPDLPVSMDYFKRFSASEDVYAETGRTDFPLFVISNDNYGIFMKDRNIASYLNFFEDEYLER